MNSQPATKTAGKSRFKLGLILGLILGVGIGVGGCLPFVFNFQKIGENEAAAKLEVTQLLEQSKALVEERQRDIDTLEGKVANLNRDLDDESKEHRRLNREVEQVEMENAEAQKEISSQGKQIEQQTERLAAMKADIDTLRKEQSDLQRENQMLAVDLRKSQASVATMQAERNQASKIPPSQRASRKDGIMTVDGMTDDVTLPLDGPINTLRIVDWPSRKQPNRFCYESSRNGQKVTLYFNLVPFGTIEHKVLQGKDTLVLKWKDDSPLFWQDRVQKNRDVTFEKQVAYQLTQSGLAFLYDSKNPTREKLIDLTFIAN